MFLWYTWYTLATVGRSCPLLNVSLTVSMPVTPFVFIAGHVIHWWFTTIVHQATVSRDSFHLPTHMSSVPLVTTFRSIRLSNTIAPLVTVETLVAYLLPAFFFRPCLLSNLFFLPPGILLLLLPHFTVGVTAVNMQRYSVTVVRELVTIRIFDCCN